MQQVEFVRAVEELEMLRTVSELSVDGNLELDAVYQRIRHLVTEIEDFYIENGLITSPPILRT